MPLMVSMLKITVRQSMDISCEGMPSMAIRGAVAHVGQHVAESLLASGHLQTHVETLGHAQFLLNVGEPGIAHIHGAGHAQLAGQFQAVRVESVMTV